MRDRHNGFAKFAKEKLRSKENDCIPQEKRSWSGVNKRYVFLLKFLSGNISKAEYLDGLGCLGDQERRAISYARRNAGYGYHNLFTMQMGDYVTHKLPVDKAAEYLKEYQSSQQQERVSSTPEPS